MHINRTFLLLGVIFVVAQPLGAEESQILACSYYDKVNPSENSSIVHAGLPWVWAKGLDGESIYVSGFQKDGFFVVHEITGRTDGCFGSRTLATYKNSNTVAKELCKRAVQEAFPVDYKNKVVLNMQVKSSFLSINHSSPVFGEPVHETKSINKLVIFGDSLSDQGNLQTWLRIVPGAPYFGGRFSNGPNWVDYLQQQTGIAVQNWAVGGSVTLMQEDRDYDWTTRLSGSVQEEINHYAEDYLDNGKLSDPDSTLFVLWVGGNDYLGKLHNQAEVDTFIDEPNDPEGGSNILIAEVTNNITNHLHSLKELGARNILVLNLPDLGTIPRVLENDTYHVGVDEPNNFRLVNLSQKLTQISQRHNQALKSSIDNFVQQFKEINIIYGDAYSGLRNVMLSRHFFKASKPMNYQLDPDFLKTIVAGKSEAKINQACFTGSILGGDNSDVCANPNKFLFWDSVHPTSFGHCLIAFGFQRNLNENNLMTSAHASNYLQACRPELNI